MILNKHKEPTLALSLIVFGLLALVPIFASPYWTGQPTRYLILGIFAMSLSLVWGRAGILCFGQAMFFGLGGYSLGVFTLGILGSSALTIAWIAIPTSVIVTSFFAFLLGIFLFRTGGISGAYLAIVTLAISIMLEQIIRSSYFLGADNGLVGIPGLPVNLNLSKTLSNYYFILAISAAIYISLRQLLASPLGIILSAVRSNPQRLEYLGYSVTLIRISVFTLGAGIAALAGALFVATESFASPKFIGFGLSAEVLIWVALGGRHILLAAFLSAATVRLLEGVLSGALGDWWLLVLGTIFMVSIILLPRGLIATPLLWLNTLLSGTKNEDS